MISLERRLELEEEAHDMLVESNMKQADLLVAYLMCDVKKIQQLKKEAMELMLKLKTIKEEIDNESTGKRE